MIENHQSEQTNLTFQKMIAIVGVVLFVAKLVAWQLTNSDAVFSDAMESIVNIIAAFMGLYSLYLASKPRDKDHPYGHGKIEFITSGIEGSLIVVAGVIIIIQAINSFILKNIPQRLDWGMVIVGLTALVNYLLGHLSYQKGLKYNSLVLQSSGKHLQMDTISTVGVVLSLILIYLTELYWIDNLVALLFGTYIIVVGYKIVRKSLSGIMDEADITFIENLASLLNEHRKPEWVDLHNVKVQQFGSRLHIDAHLTLPWYFELKHAHSEMEELIVFIAKHAERQIEFNVHMDDCKPFSCEICQMVDCPFRQKKFVQKIDWNYDTITQIKKHNYQS